MSLTKESVVVITGAASGVGRAPSVISAQEPIAGIAISEFFDYQFYQRRKAKNV
ncbi:MAG TPA: hypothetical protein VGC76_04390 [Pyrinomonadaceae bacterium]|jgi:hypothetical protein